LARAVLPGESESSSFAPMLPERKGTALPLSSTVTIRRLVNHGVSPGLTTASCAVSCADASQMFATSAPVVGSICTLVKLAPQPGSKRTR